MSDLNKEALAIWESLKPAVDKEIERKTAGTVQRRKVVVSTAPSSLTGLVGVQEPFGVEFFVPYRTEVAAATVGDPVWIEFAYGANNAVAIGMASLVDTGTQTFDDVTITGTLDITPRRCSATLSSAGWYRVLKFDNTNSAYLQGATGAEIDLHITRRRTNAGEETHFVRILFGYNDIRFVDESSASLASYFRIDKVRYTYASDGAYIDIHANAACPAVTASFEVYTDPDRRSMYTAESLQAVADSPTGETVLTTYSFAANTEYYESSTVDGVKHDISRKGDVVTISIYSGGTKTLTANAYTTVWTVPVGYRPKFTIFGVADNLGGGRLLGYNVSSTGTVNIYCNGSSTTYFSFSVSYIC